MAEYVVGNASILITPSFAGVVDAIDAEARKWADSAGRIFANTFGGIVREGMIGLLDGTDDDAAEKGSSAGGKFGDSFQAAVRAALADLPDAKITADSSDAERKLSEIRLDLLELSNKRVGIDISDDEALAKIAILKAALVEIGHSSESVSVKVNAGSAVSDLGSIPAIPGLGGAGSGIGSLGTDAEESGASIGEVLVPALALLSTTLIPIGGLAAGALSTLPAVLAGVGSGFAAIALAFPALKSTAGSVFDPLVKQLTTLVDGAILPGFESFLNNMVPVFQDLAPFIVFAAAGIGTFAEKLGGVLSSKSSLGDLNKIFSAGAGFMSDLAKAALTLVPAFLGIGAQASPILKAMGSGIDNIVKSFAKWVQNGGFEKFLTWLKSNGPGIVSVIENVAKGFGHVVTDLAPVGVAVLKVIGWFGEFGTTIYKIIVDLLTFVVPVVAVARSVIALGENWQSVWSAIRDITNTVWHAIDNDVFHPIENFFTQTIPHALDIGVGFFAALPGRITSAVGDLISAAFGDLLGVGSWISTNVIDPVVGLFGGIGDAIGKAVGAGLSALGKIGTDIINGIIGGINDGINFVDAHIPSAFGVHLFPHIDDIPLIGAKAAGGPITAGMPYLVGEFGPELIVPRMPGYVIPNHQLTAPILSGGSNRPTGPVQYVENQTIASPVDALALGSQLAFLRRAGRL